jgi:hypothetical protein
MGLRTKEGGQTFYSPLSPSLALEELSDRDGDGRIDDWSVGSVRFAPELRCVLAYRDVQGAGRPGVFHAMLGNRDDVYGTSDEDGDGWGELRELRIGGRSEESSGDRYWYVDYNEDGLLDVMRFRSDSGEAKEFVLYDKNWVPTSEPVIFPHVTIRDVAEAGIQIVFDQGAWRRNE